MRCCTYLRVSRIEQNNGVALERMLFDAERAIQSFGGTLDPDLVFKDLISGRKNDRPDFSAIWGLIEAKAVDVVVFYRVDRLGRDAELLLRLGKLFETTGVRAYICEKNKFLNWSDLDDWDYWTRSSVAAERESRVITNRLEKAHEFSRHKGQATWVHPFGYRRNADRLYEFDPEEQPIAVRMIEIYEEEKANTKRTCDRIFKEFGRKWTEVGLRHWIRNPVLRGHTPYGRNKGTPATLYNSHSGIEPDGDYNPEKDFRLLSEEKYQEFERMLENRKTYKGINANKDQYPLTGLVWCSCGVKCSVARSTRQRRDERIYVYIRCRAGVERFRGFPQHPKRSARYDEIEKMVISYLASGAKQLINSVVVKSDPLPQSPEVLKRQAHIQHLQQGITSFGDASGEQARVIAKLQMEITELTQSKADTVKADLLRARLKAFSEEGAWHACSTAELRDLFQDFLSKVLVNFETRELSVVVNPLLDLRSDGSSSNF